MNINIYIYDIDQSIHRHLDHVVKKCNCPANPDTAVTLSSRIPECRWVCVSSSPRGSCIASPPPIRHRRPVATGSLNRWQQRPAAAGCDAGIRRN